MSKTIGRIGKSNWTFADFAVVLWTFSAFTAFPKMEATADSKGLSPQFLIRSENVYFFNRKRL
jgi:hypothetical protein